MGYKYDKHNGVTMQNQIGADRDEFNPEIIEIVVPINKLATSDVRTAINIISNKEKRQEVNRDLEKQAIKNREKISMTKNENLVSDIQKDMKEEYNDNRKNITITKGGKNTSDDGKEIGA